MAKGAIALAWSTCLGALLLWQTAVRASRPDGIDLTSYLLSARAIMHGDSPYLLPTPFPYLYPPTLAFLLAPFTMVPAFAALVVWFALSTAAAVWAIRRVVLSARPDLETRTADLTVFLAVFCTFFFTVFQYNLRNGQVNFIVMALCVAAALPRPGRPAPGDRPDLFWSLAISIKIVPLVLVPYFALRRRWPWMIYAAAACVAFLLLPALVAAGRIIDIYRQYSDVLLASSMGAGPEPLDFSLAGTIAALTATPLTPMLRLSAAAVVLGWILQADGRRLRGEDTRPLALYLLGIPLASPKSEVHHLAFVLPAAAVIAARWRRRPGIGGPFALVAAALYLAATMLPAGKGVMYSAALIAAGVALMKSRGHGDHNREDSRAAALDH